MIYETFLGADSAEAYGFYRFISEANLDKSFVIHANPDGWVVRERYSPSWNRGYLLWRRAFMAAMQSP